MRWIVFVPLFAVVLIAYNVIMLTTDLMTTNPVAFSVPLMANDDRMNIHWGDVLVMLGVIFLYFEILKAARASKATIADHIGSIIVFIIFLIEFIVVAGAGTATFMILTLMSLLDVVAGFTVSISTARRDFGFNSGDLG